MHTVNAGRHVATFLCKQGNLLPAVLAGGDHEDFPSAILHRTHCSDQFLCSRNTRRYRGCGAAPGARWLQGTAAPPAPSRDQELGTCGPGADPEPPHLSQGDVKPAGLAVGFALGKHTQIYG